MTELMGKGSSFVRDLGEAARENPISAALIGMGILWMFGGGAASVARRARVDRLLDRAGEASEATSSMIRSTGARLGENVTSATRKVQSSASAAIEGATRFGREQVEGASRFGREQIEEAGRFGQEQTDTFGRYAKSLPEYARAIPESGGEMMHTLRSNLAELFKAQPLALGAIGLAIGAGIAAALPPTKAESEYSVKLARRCRRRPSSSPAKQRKSPRMLSMPRPRKRAGRGSRWKAQNPWPARFRKEPVGLPVPPRERERPSR